MTYRLSPEQAEWPRKGVFKLPDQSGWMVLSSSQTNVYWHVTFGHHPRTGSFWGCGCPWGQNHPRMGSSARLDDPCQHIRRVIRAEQADGIPPRPEPHVNPGAFVD